LKWITLEELMLIHERVVDETGGVHGVINPGGLDSEAEITTWLQAHVEPWQEE